MATTNRFSRADSHSTTAADGWSSARIATTAVFCALALATSFVEIPIFPPAPWLMYDPSGIVCMVAGFAFGPATGIAVTLVSWILHLIFKFNPWGVLMAILALLSYVVPASYINREKPTLTKAIVGMVVGAVVSLAVCIGANIVITPLYTSVDTQTVIGMIVPILLPFNGLKLIINTVATALLYTPVMKVLGR